MSSPVPNSTSRSKPRCLNVELLVPSYYLWFIQPTSLQRAELIQMLAEPVSKITLKVSSSLPILISPVY